MFEHFHAGFDLTGSNETFVKQILLKLSPSIPANIPAVPILHPITSLIVILLITGTLHERDTSELIERCHPLGVFESMPALCIATNVAELYNTVLVDTPLGNLIIIFSALF